MTNQEALSTLRDSIKGCGYQCPIEVYERAIEALEMQVSKPPILDENLYPEEQYKCPICGSIVGFVVFRNTPFGKIRSWYVKYKHCIECGQAIDWSETK